MGPGAYLKRGFNAAATMGLSEVKKAYYDDPANEQKNAYTKAGADAAALGSSQRDYETQQGNTALGYYSGPQAPTGPRPTVETQKSTFMGGKTHDRMKEMAATAAQADWDKQNAAYEAAKNGPISPDQSLMNLTNNRPGQQQSYYDYMGGQAGKATNQEELYNARKTGMDPAAAYEDQRATEGINKQLAARGRFNSGAGVRQISDYLANANAQRSHDLGVLAGGADASRNSLNTTYGTSARGASGEQSQYFGDVMNSSMGLADAKAGVFGHYSDRGSDQYSQGQMAQIEAKLAEMGVDAATAHQWISDLGKTGEAGLKLVKTAKGG